MGSDVEIELEQIRRRKMIELRKKGDSGNKDPTHPTVLTDGTLQEFVASNKLSVIDCWAAWCGPCMMLAPIIDQLAAEYSGRVAFGKLNVDENPSTSAQYGIMSIPTLLIFNNGQLVDRMVGVQPLQSLKAGLDGYLTK